MATNPFEDNDALFLVLINEENQHSIWPAANEVPAGWTAVLGKTSRQEAIDYVEANWTDMRPKSLADAVDRSAQS
ncbi:MbtH family protein [Streptomyces sp. NPDC050732]|uniref:MbtH family protein n=1 Tax=Streptomyces sp. NPDC050732 TaxID=3154632 RepID=UPI00342D9EFB